MKSRQASSLSHISAPRFALAGRLRAMAAACRIDKGAKSNMHTGVTGPLDRWKVARLGIARDSVGKIIQKPLGRLGRPLDAGIVRLVFGNPNSAGVSAKAGVARGALNQPRCSSGVATGLYHRGVTTVRHARRWGVNTRYGLACLVEQGFGFDGT